MFDEQITPEVLCKAIAYQLGYPEAATRDLAMRLLNMFSDDGTVLDNSFDPIDRGDNDIYALEDAGLLTNASDEETIYDGRTWRIQRWKMNKPNILKYAKRSKEKPFLEAIPDNVYANGDIPDDAWRHDEPEEQAPAENKQTSYQAR